MYSILIIEDDASLCSNMELILKMEGFTVYTAGDGADGLDMIMSKRPDLILCDIMMPEIDGHMLLNELKSSGLYADIPFIFVTALGERADVRRGMSSGADDYLSKPFSADELVSAVTGRLRRLEAILVRGARDEFSAERAHIRKNISARELEILLLVGKGATSKDIADQLGISLRTVEVHRSNLMSKLNCGNAAMLARWSIIAELM